MSGSGPKGEDTAEASGGLESATGPPASAERRYLNALPNAFYVLDDAGQLVDWNDQLEARTEYPVETLGGRPAETLVADDDTAAFADWLDRLLDGTESASVQVALVSADGTEVPHRLDAGSLHDEGGSVVGVSGTATDISDQVARRREYEEKAARLERFASIVSHDLRNPLTVAEGYLDLARSEHDAAHLDEVAAAHDRMRDRIETLLDLAKKGSEVDDPETVDLAGVVTDAWTAVATESASLSVAGSLGSVRGDRDRLGQLFENLFRNCVEHGSTSKRSAVRSGDSVEHSSTSSREPSDGVTVTVGATEEGFYVADDGPGLPAELADPFEDGVTTKAGGTGLGLAIVESVADEHDWTVEVSESADGGARFEFRRQ